MLFGKNGVASSRKRGVHYVRTGGKENLRERLKLEAHANAARDLELAQEWFPLEEEAWQITEGKKKPK